MLAAMLQGLTGTELKKAVRALAGVDGVEGCPDAGAKGEMIEGLVNFFYPLRKRKRGGEDEEDDLPLEVAAGAQLDV